MLASDDDAISAQARRGRLADSVRMSETRAFLGIFHDATAIGFTRRARLANIISRVQT